MIRSRIRIHDKFSVVIDVTYDKLFNTKKSKYTTLTYLFIPDSLNINKKTYPATKFYNDVRVFVKYDIPAYTIDDIDKGEDSLLKNLISNTRKFIKYPNKKNRAIYKEQVKMFAATFTGLIRDQNRSFMKSESVDMERVDFFLKRIISIQSEVRRLVEKIKKTPYDDRDKNVLLYADEHISNVIELQLMKLYNYLKSKKISSDELSAIVKLINSEQRYKKQKQYISPKDKNIDPDEMLYKRSQLKKYIEDVFYLNQDIRKDGALFEQTLLALAAGLAMIFSTGIAFYVQQKQGNFTTSLFIALVISYMMKDRIKWMIGMMFVSKSSSFFYDYKVKITNSIGEKIGMVRENFDFVPLHKLGDKVKKHRLKNRLVGMSENSLHEQIIQYKKKIVIYSEKFGDDLPDKNIVGLTDITRFNFHRFIQYMDDPKQEYILVKKGEIYNKIANKNYHINIIQKYYTEEGIEFSRYRVVINRNGIKRIVKIPLEDL